MSVKGTNERTFKDNKNAKENLLKFSTTANIQAKDYAKDNSGGGGGVDGNKVFKEIMVAEQANVSDFKTEMVKRTEILSLTSKDMLQSSSHQEAIELEIVSCTNCQHLQEQFNNNNNNSNSNYSTSYTKEVATFGAAEMLRKQQTRLDSAVAHQRTAAAEGDLKDTKISSLYEAPPSSICLHLYISEPPSASQFHRSPLFWRCCCLFPNTLKECSPVLRYLLFLTCFIFMLMFLTFSTVSKSFAQHYNASVGQEGLY